MHLGRSRLACFLTGQMESSKLIAENPIICFYRQTTQASIILWLKHLKQTAWIAAVAHNGFQKTIYYHKFQQKNQRVLQEYTAFMKQTEVSCLFDKRRLAAPVSVQAITRASPNISAFMRISISVARLFRRSNFV